jgi:hypothetical protein
MRGHVSKTVHSHDSTQERANSHFNPSVTTQPGADHDLTKSVQRAMHNPERLKARDVLTLQRRAGNRAVAGLLRRRAQPVANEQQGDQITFETPANDLERARHPLIAGPQAAGRLDGNLSRLIQRVELNWNVISPDYKNMVGMKKSSDQMAAIGAEVGKYNLKAVADFTGKKTICEKLLVLITAWRALKKRLPEADTAVDLLEPVVRQKLQAANDSIEHERLEMEQAQAGKAVFDTLEPALAQYAKRGYLGVDKFKPGAGGTYSKALSKPRGAHGELTAEAITAMNAAEQHEVAGPEKEARKAPEVGTADTKGLQDLMGSKTNALTGKTMYPELRNLTNPLDPGTNPDTVSTDTVNVGGVDMQVEHNTSDVNFTERLKLVSDAVGLLHGAGITVPGLKLHMPKYGRELKVSATAGVGGDLSCSDDKKSSRAVFVPPDFLHLSSEIIGTPNLTKVINPSTHLEEYAFSSTGFDPSGVATLVHEFGHVLHFTSAPGKFHGMWNTVFKGPELDKAKAFVSEYGSKPREFVAEVFLGLIYNKAYPDDVLRIYKAFGGYIPPALAGRFAAL